MRYVETWRCVDEMKQTKKIHKSNQSAIPSFVMKDIPVRRSNHIQKDPETLSHRATFVGLQIAGVSAALPQWPVQQSLNARRYITH